MTTYYVDAARPDDTGNGLTTGTAKKTVAAGLALVTAAGDVVQVAAGTYTQTATLNNGTAGTRQLPITVRGAAGGARPLITTATNGLKLWIVTADYLDFEHLAFSSTAATRGNGFTPTGTVRNFTRFRDCTFDGFGVAIQGDYVTDYTIVDLVVSGCEVKNCVSHGVANGPGTYMEDCVIRDNGGDGWRFGNFTTGGTPLRASRCIFARNNIGVNHNSSQAGHLYLAQCTFRGNTSHGVSLADTVTTQTHKLMLHRNVLYGNGGYGVNFGYPPQSVSGSYNAYGANTSGARNNVAAMMGDVALTADPHTDQAGNDFSLNGTAGGGAACKVSFAFPGSITTSYADIGAVQSTAAGAAATFHPLAAPIIRGIP